MNAKEQVLEAIRALPDDVKWEEILAFLRLKGENDQAAGRVPILEGEARARLLAKVRAGIEAAEAGQLVDQSELERRLLGKPEPTD